MHDPTYTFVHSDCDEPHFIHDIQSLTELIILTGYIDME